MAKGWVNIETVNTVKYDGYSNVDQKRRGRHFDSVIRNLPKQSAKQLKDEGEDLWVKKNLEEEALLAAFNDKKLKNKDAIKRAIKLKKAREAAAAKEAAKQAKG